MLLKPWEIMKPNEYRSLTLHNRLSEKLKYSSFNFCSSPFKSRRGLLLEGRDKVCSNKDRWTAELCQLIQKVVSLCKRVRVVDSNGTNPVTVNIETLLGQVYSNLVPVHCPSATPT